jgi:hypothetical protein
MYMGNSYFKLVVNKVLLNVLKVLYKSLIKNKTIII